MILGAHVNSLITRLPGDAAALAEQNNALQALAERARLGIPLTISTDPRNHFQYTLGASVAPGASRSGPKRWASPPSATRLSCGALPKWRGASTARWAST